MLARFQRRFRQREMGIIGRGDDDQIDIRVAQSPWVGTTSPGQSACTFLSSLLETATSVIPGVPLINGA
jgi:hypothetical protein